MKFLVDAQLPQYLAKALLLEGYDTIHTSSLGAQNRTPDQVISRIADSEDRILITKDSDFVASHYLEGSPAKLLLVSTGNIANDDLWVMLHANLKAIEEAFASVAFVEINRSSLILH